MPFSSPFSPIYIFTTRPKMLFGFRPFSFGHFVLSLPIGRFVHFLFFHSFVDWAFRPFSFLSLFCPLGVSSIFIFRHFSVISSNQFYLSLLAIKFTHTPQILYVSFYEMSNIFICTFCFVILNSIFNNFLFNF